MKKHVVLLITLILLFSIFIYFYFRESSYELEYNIDGLDIIEKYDKDLKAYYFNIEYQENNYELVSLDKYTTKRRLINSVEISEKEQETCFSFQTTKINLYDICTNNDSYYVSTANNKAKFKTTDTYKNIDISQLDDKTYLLWNYHDFIYLNNTTKKTLKLFSKDVYNMPLIYAFDNYLLVPDYEQEYIFDEIYLINTKNAKITDINLRFDVYFNSYFLGNDKNNVYLYDLKENQEFYIDLNKKEIYKTNNKILIDREWQDVSNQNFQKNKPTFSESKSIYFSLENEKIYLSIPDGQDKTLISNREVTELVYNEGLTVYYISEDVLYKNNPYTGEEAILKYSEWNFNYQNMIFIF